MPCDVYIAGVHVYMVTSEASKCSPTDTRGSNVAVAQYSAHKQQERSSLKKVRAEYSTRTWPVKRFKDSVALQICRPYLEHLIRFIFVHASHCNVLFIPTEAGVLQLCDGKKVRGQNGVPLFEACTNIRDLGLESMCTVCTCTEERDYKYSWSYTNHKVTSSASNDR